MVEPVETPGRRAASPVVEPVETPVVEPPHPVVEPVETLTRSSSRLPGGRACRDRHGRPVFLRIRRLAVISFAYARSDMPSIGASRITFCTATDCASVNR